MGPQESPGQGELGWALLGLVGGGQGLGGLGCALLGWLLRQVSDTGLGPRLVSDMRVCQVETSLVLLLPCLG